jgi:uncharacterized protein YuzE
MIETRYDPEADVLHVAFGAPGATYDSAEEVAPGVYVEFDHDGQPMGVEITSARWISKGRPVALPEIALHRSAAE